MGSRRGRYVARHEYDRDCHTFGAFCAGLVRRVKFVPMAPLGALPYPAGMSEPTIAPTHGLDAAAARRRLEDLATAPVGRSKAAMLADVLDGVERALRGGASRAQVIEALRASGLGFSPQTFAKTLARLRARRRRHATHSDLGQGGSPSGSVAGREPDPDPANLRSLIRRSPSLESLLHAPHEREVARLQGRLASPRDGSQGRVDGRG